MGVGFEADAQPLEAGFRIEPVEIEHLGNVALLERGTDTRNPDFDLLDVGQRGRDGGQVAGCVRDIDFGADDINDAAPDAQLPHRRAHDPAPSTLSTDVPSTGLVISTVQSPRHSKASMASRPRGWPAAASRSST